MSSKAIDKLRDMELSEVLEKFGVSDSNDFIDLLCNLNTLYMEDMIEALIVAKLLEVDD